MEPSSEHLRVEAEVNSVISWLTPPGAGEVASGGALSGLTFGVKDNIEVAEARTTCASEFFTDRVSTLDAPVVGRLRDAGGLLVATLNLAEFAVGVTSQNSAAGGPRNPWDTRRVPAGSSGGSGAAVAAGLVDFALGTDSGGSIRLPAAACGVSGLRPSLGLVDTTGVYPVSSDFDTVGPMARSVELVERVFDVVSDLPRRARPRPSVLGVPRRFVTDEVDPSIRAAVAEMVSTLRELGQRVVEIDVPGAESAQDHVYTLLYSDLARLHRERLRTEPERFQPATLERIRVGLQIGQDARRAAMQARSDFRANLRRVFEEVEVVVTPTLPVDVPFADARHLVLDQSRRLSELSYPWSLHNGPTLSLPVGFHSASGMPIGAQLTAAHADEAALFTLGRDYQNVTDWHSRRPPVFVGSGDHM